MSRPRRGRAEPQSRRLSRHRGQSPRHRSRRRPGDFNFIRSEENRNRPGGDVNDMFRFNDIIGHLGLVELPLKGRAFTWSNMQEQPLLEQLDWFFTSVNWTSVYPNTVVLPLAKSSSDHVPCMVNISTVIPKATLFRFESFWVDQPGFLEVVKGSWENLNERRLEDQDRGSHAATVPGRVGPQ